MDFSWRHDSSPQFEQIQNKYSSFEQPAGQTFILHWESHSVKAYFQSHIFYFDQWQFAFISMYTYCQ
ncbi:MAG TPA: hypothetical protein DIW81_01340 [Planctomycetaceae bacterium]|nr:hypothetical protein [Planctomycetaceae bacterium]